MKRKIAILIAVIMTFALLPLNGCDGGGAGREGIYPVDKLYKGKLNVAIAYPAGKEEGFARLVEEYNKYQPNVEVTFNVSTGTDYTTWLSNELQSSAITADIVSTDSAYSPKYVDFGVYKNKYNQYTGNRFREDYDFNGIKKLTLKGEQQTLYTQAARVLTFYKGGKWDKIQEHCRRVYEPDGISPTVHCAGGGNTEPKIIEDFYKARPPRVYEGTAPALRNGRDGLKVVAGQFQPKDRDYTAKGIPRA
ncbi:hypothetical protein FACS1894211_11470 [Clostridia bacterium]|nr:hypothetical protein FACS1894211_11470 [Clostridia bacterium]